MKDTNLQEMIERLGEVIGDYDWEKNKGNVGMLLIAGNLDGYRVEAAGRMAVIIQALVNEMTINADVREIVIQAHDHFVNVIADAVKKEKSNKPRINHNDMKCTLQSLTEAVGRTKNTTKIISPSYGRFSNLLNKSESMRGGLRI